MNTGAEQTLQNPEITYSILNPTGNITALVESPVDIPHQPAVAEEIMKRHPDVEQVGFVRFYGNDLTSGSTDCKAESRTLSEDACSVQAELRMAGGEFCGNASLCAAALYLIRTRTKDPGFSPESSAVTGNQWKAGEYSQEETVRLSVSGAADPVEVRLSERKENVFHAGILMPAAQEIVKRQFRYQELSGMLTVIRMEGISHILIDHNSCFSGWKDSPETAEAAVRSWCEELSAEGLGLMFLDGRSDPGQTSADRSSGPGQPEEGAFRLTPLVYIPGSDTMFWENSCASGSAACGMALSLENGGGSRFVFSEPGGNLTVISEAGSPQVRLCGNVRLTGTYTYQTSVSAG